MNEIRRMRPGLGTLVEIAVSGLPAPRLLAALDQAFAAVQRVHDLMSFHDPSSDVSRLNREAARRFVVVDAWTLEVLEAALDLFRRSSGLFDITVADRLVQWRLLPRPGGWTSPRVRAGSMAIEQRPGRRVRFLRPLVIDLGGIAKGFAVDKAVAALQEANVPCGMVNAGGDLRVWGPRVWPVQVRHPGAPAVLLPLGGLRNRSVATSAPYFSAGRHRGRAVSALVHPLSGVAFTEATSVSVIAPDCMWADALTKVVMANPERAAPLLRACRARAVIVAAPGSRLEVA